MPTKDRQRAKARAKLERQMARRAESARKRRQVQAGIAAAVGLALIVAAGIWVFSSLSDDNDKKSDDKAAGCFYKTVKPGGQSKVKEVSKPSQDSIVRDGTQIVTLSTTAGDLKIELDQKNAPCTSASWINLANQNFYNDTICHRMTAQLVQCGDPFANLSEEDGRGGPSYEYANENLPTGIHPTGYVRGVVAMANSGPDTNGSQFFILWDAAQYSPDYNIVGKVTEDSYPVLDALKAIGNDASMDPNPGGGKPLQEVKINTLTVQPKS